MSTDFVRDGFTRSEGFSTFHLPHVFSKSVLMLSSLRTDNLQKYKYIIKGISSLDDLKDFIHGVLADTSY